MTARLIGFWVLVLATFLTAPGAFARGEGNPKSLWIKAYEGPRDSNFAVNVEPLWLVLSGVGLKGEYFISNRVSAGVSGMFIPRFQTETTGSATPTKYSLRHNELLLGVNVMLSGNLRSNGLYVNPSLGYQKTEIFDYGPDQLSGSLSTPMARMTAGYQWITENNVRFGLGAGLSVIPGGDISIADRKGTEVYRGKASTTSGLALDLHVGYLF